MSDVFKKLPVPGSRDFVAATAEKYFTTRLLAHYGGQRYLCCEEYGYAGGSSFYPLNPSAGHTNPQLDRVLRMLQGDRGAGIGGFQHPPKLKDGQLKDGGFQKPDFLAFRAHEGVVAEVGTADMRAQKKLQLDKRLRALAALTDARAVDETYRRQGQPLGWYGMRWRPAEFLPPEGPVLIPVDASRVVSTAPTWRWPQPGIYLYELFQYERHGKPVGVPVSVPRLSDVATRQAQQMAQQYATRPAASGSLDPWPRLRDELRTTAKSVGVFAALGALAVIAALAAPEATAAAAVAGLATMAHRSLAGGRPGA